ncbi:hypothetical protein D3C77_282820 [compost metagenome]
MTALHRIEGVAGFRQVAVDPDLGAITVFSRAGSDKRPWRTWLGTQRKGQRQVELSVTVRETVAAQILGMGYRKVVVHITPAVVVASGITLGAAAVPVALVTGIDIDTSQLTVVTQSLVDGEVSSGLGVASTCEGVGT